MRPTTLRALAVLLLVGVFAAGAITGAAVNHLTGASAGARLAGERIGSPGGAGVRRQPPLNTRSASSRLIESLNLTAEQTALVESVFEKRRQRTEALLAEIGPSLRAQTDSTHAEIRALLTPEQQLRFDRISARRAANLPGFRSAPPPR